VEWPLGRSLSPLTHDRERTGARQLMAACAGLGVHPLAAVTGRALLRRIAFACVRWSGLPFLIRETVQRRRVTILYHHDADPSTLDVQLKALSKRYNLVDLRTCIDALLAGRMDLLPPKPLVLTFDDGWKGNYDLLEVFRRYGVTPTIFLCSGVVATHRAFWWTVVDDPAEVERLKRAPTPERLIALSALGYAETLEYSQRSALSRSEIEEMRDRVDFEAHTVYHPILTGCDDETSWREISGSDRTTAWTSSPSRIRAANTRSAKWGSPPRRATGAR
jgi:peptidoglycan/xylan/chitin deacetylase (PgdA/CDA1 family)